MKNLLDYEKDRMILAADYASGAKNIPEKPPLPKNRRQCIYLIKMDYLMFKALVF